MEIGNTNVKIGDLFEWHYVYNDDDNLVRDDEEIGTYDDLCLDNLPCKFYWFPIGNICLMLAITSDRFFWISKNKFCFCYHSDDYLRLTNTPFLAITKLD